MRLLRLGAIVPHAPLLVPGVAGPKVEAETDTVRAAISAIDLDGVDLVVVVSPHGARPGVYEHATGDLGAFGVAGARVEIPADGRSAADVAERAGLPLLQEPLDHGAVVPLLLLALPEATRVVAATLGEGAQSSNWFQEGSEALVLADAIGSVAGDDSAAVVASANTSAALTPAAPLTERHEGKEFEKAVVEAMTHDVARVAAIDERLWDEGGSCGAGPLAALGRLFGGRAARILCHEYPFGVGYLAATVG